MCPNPIRTERDARGVHAGRDNALERQQEGGHLQGEALGKPALPTRWSWDPSSRATGKQVSVVLAPRSVALCHSSPRIWCRVSYQKLPPGTPASQETPRSCGEQVAIHPGVKFILFWIKC